MNRTLIDQSLPTRMTREQAIEFARWLDSMAAHARWCLDEFHPPMPSTPLASVMFEWVGEHGDLARLWIANNVGGEIP